MQSIEEAVREYLATHFAEYPQSLRVSLEGEEISVNVVRPFPPAELRLMYNHSDSESFHRYYSAMFKNTEQDLKDRIGRLIGCHIKEAAFVINAAKQELDIVLTKDQGTRRIP